MKKFDVKRQLLIENVANYIIENGIKSSSLRNIAEAISTSNRMLLHYFEDKEELMTVTLEYITNNFLEIIEGARTEKMSFNNLMPYLYHALKMEEIRPYTKLCLELISLSAKKEEPYYSIARKIGEIFSNWIENAMEIAQNEDKEEKLALALVIIEGFVVLNALDYDEKIENAIKKIYKEFS